jgi:hypothetical protein
MASATQLPPRLTELAVQISARRALRRASALAYSGKGEHRFRREAEGCSGAKVNSSRSEATLA